MDEEFDIEIGDYVAGTGQPMTPAPQTLQTSQTPQVDPNLMTQAPQEITQTGLTHTENALLSNEEKAMRLRQRGMA